MTTADIVIIGGDIIGASIAYQLALQSLPVVKRYRTSVSRRELSKARPGSNVLRSMVA